MLTVTACLLLQACNSPVLGPTPQDERTINSEVWLSVDEYSGPGNCTLHIGDARKRIEGVTAGPWVPAWRAFAVVREGEMYALSASGDLIGPKGVAVPEQARRSVQWSVSPDGTLLAEFDDVDFDLLGPVFAVHDMATGSLVVKLDREDLERAIGKRAEAQIAFEGVAWTPSSDRVAFGHSFGGDVDNGGVSETRIAVWSRKTGQLSHWAPQAPPNSLGGPVAWLSEDRLLVHGGLGHRIVQAAGPGRLHEDTAIMTWDGRDLIVLRSIPGPDQWHSSVRLERWTPDLSRRISARDLPQVGWADVNRGVYFALREEGK